MQYSKLLLYKFSTGDLLPSSTIPSFFPAYLIATETAHKCSIRASWAVRWPAICLILFELDHIFHNEDVPPAPPQIGTSLVVWLHR
ncbi:hypothetical protein BD408DRAFT_426013 [Parasitella parasitica]|nr:hypothetical protein BD408DRAFT_426013 [Parasitella parasitica]